MSSVLPNFFLVGAPKAGTTSLYHYLRQHPQIYMSPVKEPNYFASEIRIENVCGHMRDRAARDAAALQEYLRGPMSEPRFGGMVSSWDDYLKLFQSAGAARAVGEASVCYLWSPTAAANIFAKVPDARILAVLRNPADQAFSQYWHTVNAGAARTSFRRAVEISLRHAGRMFDVFYPFLELGLYYEQVRRYFDVFGRNRVRIYLFEDEYRARPQQMLTEIFDFLGVDPGFSPDMSQRYLESQAPRSLAVNGLLKRHGVWGRLQPLCPPSLRQPLKALLFKRRGPAAISAEDRAFLIDYYREDIWRLADLLQRDLSVWCKMELAPFRLRY
ncbi:MAG TPA: sulfotransferase [Bryobacteraceae bacterium]|nr:sulfotransferase [Bryobacteraceae bacterium]